MSSRAKITVSVLVVVGIVFASQVYANADFGNGGGSESAISVERIYGKLVIPSMGGSLINESPVLSGATVLSGARIKTRSGVGVSLLLGSLGRVDVGPDSEFVVNFGLDQLDVSLTAGCVEVRNQAGVSASVKTFTGNKVSNGQLGQLSACSGKDGAPATAQSQGPPFGSGDCCLKIPTHTPAWPPPPFANGCFCPPGRPPAFSPYIP